MILSAINPGNSGGPLINLKGNVIGINTAIFSKSGGYMGIGFAIPINMAKSVMESLIEGGEVVRGYLGVMIQDLSEDLASSFSFPNAEGALVGDVSDDSPAFKAGFKQGDIITEFDGKKITSSSQLRNLVAQTSPGDRVKVKVYRDKDYETLSVKIGKLDSNAVVTSQQDTENELGMGIQNLNSSLAQQFGIDSSTQGVVVSQLQSGGLAQMSGIKVGDVIVEVQGRAVRNVSDFQRALKKHGLKKGVRLMIKRGQQSFFVFIKNS